MPKPSIEDFPRWFEQSGVVHAADFNPERSRLTVSAPRVLCGALVERRSALQLIDSTGCPATAFAQSSKAISAPRF